MTYIFKCKFCKNIIEYATEYPNQDIHSVAYIVGARHEQESIKRPPDDGNSCFMRGSRNLVLVELKND